MASEDVIELGSSDEEPAPIPKKIKLSKPVSNAMVHIPKELCGITIQPTIKDLDVGPQILNMPKIISVGNSIPNLHKKNNTQVKPVSTILQQPIPIQNKSLIKGINPMGLIRKLNNSQIVINRVNTKKNKSITPKLLPNITITKMKPNLKRLNILNAQCLNNKKPRLSNNVEVPTFELDEEESPVTAGPQWYLRPEEQTNVDDIKESNDEEPNTAKFIEITIDDSPVKPTSGKNNSNNPNQSAIIVDDSPAKSSDKSENSTKTLNSKKQLQYPEDIENKTIEIEIEPIEMCVISNAVSITKDVNSKDDEETGKGEPLKQSKQEKDKDDVNIIQNVKMSEDNIENLENDTLKEEFHPVYQSFIDLCFQLENTDDMKKIVDKKIKTYYRQVPKEYTESEQFIDMVSSKINAMKNGPDKLYLYIKDIVDELNIQRKMTKVQVMTKNSTKTESDVYLYGENSEYDLKRQTQIHKLEKTLRKLHRAIQKLEEQEVDFDDEEDSVYLLTERYKERMVRVHAKFCQMTNTKMPSEPYIHIDPRPGQPMGPIKKIEKLINKKVPLGTPLPFPDFHDVLSCVREANDEEKFGWNEADIIQQARDLFTRCGKKLQRRRQENEWRLAFSRVSSETDPAENNDELKKKLDANLQLASKKETDVFNKYADRQVQMKLEAEEIGDKEANESPIESEDDEGDDEVSLKNKENRKKRLKRLIEENSKKSETSENTNMCTNQQDEVNQSQSSIIIGEVAKQGDIQNINTSTDQQDEGNQSKSPIIIAKMAKQDDTHIDKLTKQDNTNIGEALCQDDTNANNEPILENTVNQITEKPNSDSIHSLSDDSTELMSDIDELHLLQKIHSKDDVNILESSDSDVSAANSLSSIKEVENADDIISIENSSYSESDVPVLSDDDKDSSDVNEIVNNSDENIQNQSNKEMEDTVLTLSDNETISSKEISGIKTLEKNSLFRNEKNISGNGETNVDNTILSIESNEGENVINTESNMNDKIKFSDDTLTEQSANQDIQDKILEDTLLALSDDDTNNDGDICDFKTSEIELLSNTTDISKSFDDFKTVNTIDLPVACGSIDTTETIKITNISEDIILDESDNKVYPSTSSLDMKINFSRSSSQTNEVTKSTEDTTTQEVITMDVDVSLNLKEKDMSLNSLSENVTSDKEKCGDNTIDKVFEANKISLDTNKQENNPEKKEEQDITDKAGANTQIHMDSALTDTTNVLLNKCTSLVSDKNIDNFEEIGAPMENVNC